MAYSVIPLDFQPAHPRITTAIVTIRTLEKLPWLTQALDLEKGVLNNLL